MTASKAAAAAAEIFPSKSTEHRLSTAGLMQRRKIAERIIERLLDEQAAENEILKQQLAKFDLCSCGHNRVDHNHDVPAGSTECHNCSQCECREFSLILKAGETIMAPEQLAEVTNFSSQPPLPRSEFLHSHNL